MLFNSIVNKIKSLKHSRLGLTHLIQIKDILLFQYNQSLIISSENNISKKGIKCFSQNEEDGITLEIIKRIGVSDTKGVFLELGVGSGIENNTLILRSLEWAGIWIGGDDLVVKPKSPTFSFFKEWITRDNIIPLIEEGLRSIDKSHFDVISVDLDGNDYYITKKILENGYDCKLFIIEYNAKYPPPVRFKITYNESHEWNGDDYFGASLQSFADLFTEYDYFLVACNQTTGSNAFFVHSSYKELFADINKSINSIWVGPRYHLFDNYGHKPSVKTIEKIINYDCVI